MVNRVRPRREPVDLELTRHRGRCGMSSVGSSHMAWRNGSAMRSGSMQSGL